MSALAHPVRHVADDCVRCEKPIQPGQLYAVLASGPQHFGCEAIPEAVSERCDQSIQGGERCLRRATWSHQDKRTGALEGYCTQHANYYGVARRGGERIT